MVAEQPMAEWVFVLGPIAFAGAGLAILTALGRSQRKGLVGLVLRTCDSLERLTGQPAWAAGAVLLATWALAVALTGFIWDVAWHTDFGRDTALFTVPHTMILVGLISIGLSGLVAIGLATVTRAPVGFRFGPLRVPFSAVPLGLLSIGAAAAFPLDDLWHRTYGIDVTMWSPTHLLMIGGASLTPLAVALVTAEGGGWRLGTRSRRLRAAISAGAVLVGISTFQLEFDLGVPQWQALYHPVLIALAASIGLVAARAAIGRGGAIYATAVFLALRGGVALLVGPALGHSVPHFPMYIGSAVAVEAAFGLGRQMRPLPRGLVAGALVGTVGLAGEWGWMQIWGDQPWNSAMFPAFWVAVAIAVVGGVLGMSIGQALASRPTGIAKPVIGIALASIVVLLAMPFPRNASPISVAMTTSQVGPSTSVLNRDGFLTESRDVNVQVNLTPADSAAGADFFRVTAWQGGSVHNIPLVETSRGAYRSASPVPTGGRWKAIVYLARGDILVAAPIAMPGDATAGQQPIDPQPSATMAMVSANQLLVNPHAGSPTPARLAYVMFGITVLLWLAALITTFWLVRRREDKGAARPQGESAQGRTVKPIVPTRDPAGSSARSPG